MFISFEGIDASGKTTQIKLLKEYFENKGEKVFVVRDPGGTKVSEKIRKILLSKENLEMVKECEIFLFCASRAQMVNEIIMPKLKENYIVISDRFFDSTTAYQGYGRNMSIDTINVLHKLAINNTPPDLTFYIDISYDESIKRQNENKLIRDRMESADKLFFENVRRGFLNIAEKEPQRFRVIDGTKTIEQIRIEIVKIVEDFIKKKNDEK